MRVLEDVLEDVLEVVLDDVSVVLLIPNSDVLGHDLTLWMTHLGRTLPAVRD
jgi:hypothetical protein